MTDTNKMREEFEAAFVAKYGFGRMTASANADAQAIYQAAEWAWQASRQAVVVVLPETFEPGHGWALCMEAGEVAAAIEAQGLRVGVRK